jgi:mannuronan 5-epimerase
MNIYMRQRLPTFFLGLVAITPFLIISITAYTSEKFHYGLHDTQSISSLSVNQLREDDEQEILPKSNSFCMNYDNRTMTINICGGIVDMTALHRVINNSKVLNQTSPKNWFLNANISIAKGATLFITSTDTDWLKINSTAGTAFSIVTKGNLVIDNTKISSWNFTNKSDTLLNSKTEPRSYLVVPWDGTGHMNITNSNLSYLGYAGGNDTWGISYYSGDGSIISNSSFSFNYRGFHVSGDASDIIFVNNTINNSYQDGLVAHINSTNLQIYNNTIYNNTNHGIFCLESCENILVKDNLVYDNTGNGIFLNKSTVNSEIKNNTLYDNGRFGIALSSSSRNVIANNTINRNLVGVIVTQSSRDNVIEQNRINYSLLNGISLDENSNNNMFVNNTIIESFGNGIYVQGKGTSNNSFSENNVTKGSSFGIAFLNASNNILLDNNIYNNSNSNYYGTSGSTNTITDTIFNNTTLGVSNGYSRFILQYTDNRITGVSTKNMVNTAYPTNTTLLITPADDDSIILDTYKMNVIPSSNHVNISTFNNDFNSNQTYKKWSEISPPSTLPAKIRYMIGGFEPNTQIAINVNSSFWNAYTSNSSGYITFIYDNGHYTLTEFEAQVNNKPALSAILFLVIIVAGLVILFVIIKKHERNKIPKPQIDS